MKLQSSLLKLPWYFLLFIFLNHSCNPKSNTINNQGETLGEINTPISLELDLNKNQIKAAKEGRLAILDPETKGTIPIQLESREENANSQVVLMVTEGISKLKKLEWLEKETSPKTITKAFLDENTGQAIVEEDGKTVLQYNYQTVYEKDVIRPESKKEAKLSFSTMSGVYYEEYLKAHPELEKNDTTKSSIYSVPRSDYIHPLYGLNGEMLTNDWPDGGHPHHRGIFWAWPEVEYGIQRADIYALQRVFARPTGNIKYTSGSVFAEINAENLWMWEDKEAIVNETAIIRVYRSIDNTRIIDLTIKLLALTDSVTIATRFTNSYGGLNIRMQTPENQDISYFTDKVNSEPQRAWSDFNGIFEGNKTTSGLMVLQHNENPEYPGEWREYPNLAWVQPTFPSPDTRYKLSTDKPLVLRYRMIIHNGGKPDKSTFEKSWDAYHNNMFSE